MLDLFHRKPRLLFLTLALILVAGTSSLAILPRMEDPILVQRFAVVQAPWPGADAERVEALVTDRIERELRELEEIKLVESDSKNGIATLQLELHEHILDVDRVWSLVRDELDDAAALLPVGAEDPELTVSEVEAFTLVAALVWDPADELGGAPANHALLARFAEELEDTLRGVPGTKDVEVFGARDEEIVVELDPAVLAARGLSIGAVSSAIEASDAKVAAGLVRGAGSDLQLEVTGRFEGLERLAELVVQQGPDGRLVRLSDLGVVRKAFREPALSEALVGGREAVAVAARLLPTERVDQWSADARATLAAFEAELPRGMGVETLFDQSGYTQARLDGLFQNLYVGVGLVVLVLLFVMGWRAALLVGAALPLSLLMVLAGMRFLGIPLHQMSVTGMIIALGLLIDNAIVMVDEVRHHLRAGLTPRAAIHHAVGGLGIPLLGSTATTIFAFLPIVLMPGSAGEFVGTMAVSVILALVSSLFLALTVVPALTGMLDRIGGTPKAAAQRRSWSRDGIGFDALTRGYTAFLRVFLRRPLIAMAVAAAPCIAGFWGATQLHEQFFPPAERDQFSLEIELPVQTSMEETRRLVHAVRERLAAEHPEVVASHWFLGEVAPRFYYNLPEGRERDSSYAQALVQLDSAEGATEAINRIQRDLDAAFAGARFLARQLEQGPPFDAPVEIRVSGPDLGELRRMGDELRALLAEVPGVTHTRAKLVDARPKLWFDVDEEEARRAGFDNVALAGRLADGLEGRRGGSLIESTEELPVRVRVADEFREDAAGLGQFTLASSSANGSPAWTPLAALGSFELRPDFGAIARRDGTRTNTVQAFLVAGLLPSEVLTAFTERLERTGFEPPPGYDLSIGGESAERDRAVSQLAASVQILLVAMVATLVLSFSSFRLAGVIGTVGGLAIGLAMLALYLFGLPFGFMAIVGSMGLVGVAINDGIVVLAGLRRDEDARRGDLEATVRVTVEQTRHVLATTFTTMAGFTPLIVAGGGFWPPVAVSIGAGVLGATLLALTFVPAANRLLMRPRRRHADTVVPAPA